MSMHYYIEYVSADGEELTEISSIYANERDSKMHLAFKRIIGEMIEGGRFRFADGLTSAERENWFEGGGVASSEDVQQILDAIISNSDANPQIYDDEFNAIPLLKDALAKNGRVEICYH